MSTNAMSVIAEKVPLTIDELSALGVLGEGIVKEYGERLIKNIKAFIEQNSLQIFVQEKAIPEYAKVCGTFLNIELYSYTTSIFI
jgi:hypothetical protein